MSDGKRIGPKGPVDHGDVSSIDETVLAALIEDIGPEQLPVALELFADELGRRAADLCLAAEAPDIERLRRIAHGAKGSASTFGALSVAAAARRLEEACKAGEPTTRMPVLIEALLLQMARASEQVRKRIELLQG